MQTRIKTTVPQKRRAALLVGALGCLLVVILLAGIVVRHVVQQHRQMRDNANRLQAVWLAESGVSRAKREYAVDSEFNGLVWDISAEEMNASGAGIGRKGRVEITRQDTANAEASGPEFLVTASYPANANNAAVHRITFRPRIEAPPVTAANEPPEPQRAP